MSDAGLVRCEWAAGDALMLDYHDREWGAPVHDDRVLFEFLLLEGAQAGLSWLTVLRRREGYRAAYHGFDFERVARYGEDDVARLLGDAGIVRNRAKIASSIGNARAAIETREEHGSFDAYIWSFVEGRPRRNAFGELGEIPVFTPESEAMSRDLKRRGFRFVGPTICYAFMQATGMVNDHLVSCLRHYEV